MFVETDEDDENLADTQRLHDFFEPRAYSSPTQPGQLLSTSRTNEDLSEGHQQLPMESPVGTNFMSRIADYVPTSTTLTYKKAASRISRVSTSQTLKGITALGKLLVQRDKVARLLSCKRAFARLYIHS